MFALKRVFLFLAINFLVVITLSVVLNIFHVGPYLRAYGLDYPALISFCLIWGIGGAMISLALSKKMACWLLQVQIISPETSDEEKLKLLCLVEKLAGSAGIPIPAVGIYSSKEVNAFATGPTKNRALVAVSSGLLEKMNKEELEGVLAHEITHIANGDMVTMTLLQGVVNAFVMFLARIIAYSLSGLNRNQRSGGSYVSYSFFVFLFEVVFMILGMIVVSFFSRKREFEADFGGAKLAGKEKMIAALKCLRVLQQIRDPKVEQPVFQSFKISQNKPRGLLSLFSTHPPLEERIERLQNLYDI